MFLNRELSDDEIKFRQLLKDHLRIVCHIPDMAHFDISHIQDQTFEVHLYLRGGAGSEHRIDLASVKIGDLIGGTNAMRRAKDRAQWASEMAELVHDKVKRVKRSKKRK